MTDARVSRVGAPARLEWVDCTCGDRVLRRSDARRSCVDEQMHYVDARRSCVDERV